MSLVSDPNLRAASRERSAPLNAPLNAPLHGTLHEAVQAASRAALTPPETVTETVTETARARRGRSRLIFGGLMVASVLLMLRVVASTLAEPLEIGGAATAPAWQVEVSANGASPGIVLAYGPEVGVQLLRIPARDAGTDETRVIPARLARGELHLISLSPTSLHVEAPGAPGSAVVRLSANAPVITVYQSPTASGVRTGW